MLTLTDSAIKALIDEPKVIPDGLAAHVKMADKLGHLRKDFDVKGEVNRFVVKIRQSSVNPLNFSVILGYVMPGSYSVFRLRRYNGRHGQHTNRLEGDQFYDFHIHYATERYQRPGFDEDHFAEPTSRYYNLESAIGCLINECGFKVIDGPLFGKE